VFDFEPSDEDEKETASPDKTNTADVQSHIGGDGADGDGEDADDDDDGENGDAEGEEEESDSEEKEESEKKGTSSAPPVHTYGKRGNVAAARQSDRSSSTIRSWEKKPAPSNPPPDPIPPSNPKKRKAETRRHRFTLLQNPKF